MKIFIHQQVVVGITMKQNEQNNIKLEIKEYNLTKKKCTALSV